MCDSVYRHLGSTSNLYLFTYQEHQQSLCWNCKTGRKRRAFLEQISPATEVGSKKFHISNTLLCKFNVYMKRCILWECQNAGLVLLTLALRMTWSFLLCTFSVLTLAMEKFSKIFRYCFMHIHQRTSYID